MSLLNFGLPNFQGKQEQSRIGSTSSGERSMMPFPAQLSLSPPLS